MLYYEAKLALRMLNNLRVGSQLVSCDPKTVEALRRHVMDRFLSAAPVGEEAIGILYGRSGDAWCVTGWRALERENPQGPAAPLTPADEAGLRSLAAATIDGESAIGVFRSRTRGMAALSPEDVAACQRIFGDRDCLAVILRPSTQRPVVASFHVVRPGAEAESSQRGVRVALTPLEAGEEPDAAKAETPPAVEESSLTQPAAPHRWLKPALAFSAGIAFAVLAMLIFIDRPIRLRVEVRDAQVRVQWNRSAGFLTRVESASLRLGNRTVALSQSQLRQGIWIGTAPRGDFALSLHLRGGLGGPRWAGTTIIRDAARE